jgi:tRNA1(Val) A37 N6-methylase TrmN6
MERDDGLHLSLQKKREILLANIHGVDIDPQAVEVAQLSLYLKLLQDETPASARNYQMEFHETLLPTLNKNIVCGNSLIGTDILTGQLFASDEEKKLNPMDFEQRFPHIFSRGRGNESGSLRETATPLDFTFPGVPLHGSYSYKKKKGAKVALPAMPESEYEGGFDAIVGNPPYVLGRETFKTNVKDYLAKHYSSYKGKFDLYVYFTEQAARLLGRKGKLGYILPNTLLANENATLLRKYILENKTLEVIKMFSSRVFKEAQVESVVLILRNERDDGKAELIVEGDNTNKLRQSLFLKSPQFRFDVHSSSETEQLLNKIQRVSLPLGTITDICIGIQLGGSAGSKHKDAFISDNKTDASYKKVLDGKEINSYQKVWRGNYVKYGNWLHRKRDEKYFLNPKIIIRQIGATPVATLDEEYYYTLNTIYNLIGTSEHSLKFLLAIINSALGQWFWTKQNSDYKTLFPKIKKTQIESVPILKIDFSNPADKARHDRMVELVEQMLAAKKQLAGAQSDKDKDFYTNRCDGLDRQIDALVYDLYALTPAEIQIVEGEAK